MFSHFVYLGGLLVSLSGLGVLDWRYKIALFRDIRRSLKIVGLTILIFVAWDIAAILLDIFKAGTSALYLHLFLFKNFPIEELFFLALLGYMTLLLVSAGNKKP